MTAGIGVPVLSEDLEDFLVARCDADTDYDELAATVRGPSRGSFMPWLRDDLAAAIRAGDFTPDYMYDLTSEGFDRPADVDRWWRRRWAEWFDEPYPA